MRLNPRGLRWSPEAEKALLLRLWGRESPERARPEGPLWSRPEGQKSVGSARSIIRKRQRASKRAGEKSVGSARSQIRKLQRAGYEKIPALLCVSAQAMQNAKEKRSGSQNPLLLLILPAVRLCTRIPPRARGAALRRSPAPPRLPAQSTTAATCRRSVLSTRDTRRARLRGSARS